MDELLAIILSPLEVNRANVCRQIRERFEETRRDSEEYGDELHALKEALEDYPTEYPADWWMDESHCRWWLFLSVDWKASDQVEWQCQAMARTLGLEGHFLSTVSALPTQVFEVLSGAAPWFRQRGYELMCLDTQSDEQLVIPVQLGALKRAFGVMDRLGIRSFLL